MEGQTLEQEASGHQCPLTSSVCFQHLGFCFVFFCFWFHGPIVFPFTSPSTAWPRTDALGETPSQSPRELLLWPTAQAHRGCHLPPAVTSRHWFYFSSSAAVPWQLSLLYTSSPSFQGIITQPSKYQNMLWFETWCTES